MPIRKDILALILIPIVIFLGIKLYPVVAAIPSVLGMFLSMVGLIAITIWTWIRPSARSDEEEKRPLQIYTDGQRLFHALVFVLGSGVVLAVGFGAERHLGRAIMVICAGIWLVCMILVRVRFNKGTI